MDQTIRFVTSGDRVKLAYACSGDGTPLVKAANWLSHLEFDWQSPVWRHWFGFLSSGRRLVRYDSRGCGLSDWDVTDLSLAAQVADLEQRRGVHRSFGLSASRSQSPSRFTDMHSSTSARPGKTTSHHSPE